MPALNVIAPDKLLRLVGTPAAPMLVDVRAAAPRLIPGAIPHPSTKDPGIDRAMPGRNVVVVDGTGGGDAHAVAAWLRSEGMGAEVLAGGHDGWTAMGLPTVDAARLPPRDAGGRTLWVTRARPKVDRIACPWLIRRFVDPGARILYVPAAEVMSVAARTGAAPFDVDGPGVHWNHRGPACTFDAMVDGFGLGGLAGLAHLAPIVRAADTGRLDLVPEAAGLLAVSLGLSRLHADDLAQLEAGMAVYDALYRWCRDARDETHDRASHGAKVTA